jgi:tetratricopeptide (TPR) repeat protein
MLRAVDPGGPLCYLLPVSRNIDRKQLKSPDQFVSFWSRVAMFISARHRVVIAAAAAVLVLALVIWGATAALTRRAVRASVDFARIERIASADLLPATGTAPTTDDGLPHFKTEQERLEAALKESDSFIASHGGSRLKDEAQLLKAKYLLALGKAGDALPVYQGLLRGSIDDRLRFLAEEGLAYALEQSGQIDAAITAFGTLADDAQKNGGFYRDRALFNKARLLQQKGGGKEAEKLFRDILEKTPTTPLREEINDRLATLDGK